jgi:hypothetical protein
MVASIRVEADSETQRDVGPYVILGELARGALTTVHVGRLRATAGLARTVALQELHAEYAEDPAFTAIVADEARRAARAEHKNLTPMLDVLQEAGGFFLVAQYIHGEALSHLLRAAAKKRVPIPRRVFITVMAGVLHGLHAAHEARSDSGEVLGVVHGDVSPQNILLGADGVPRVFGFWVAKALRVDLDPGERALPSKLAYTSPEQLSGSAIDRRADIYAVGVMLWEGLTGQRLFDTRSSANREAVLAQKLSGTIAPPSQLVPSTPKGLDDIVLKALATSPDDRYATASEVALALEQAVPPAEAKQIGDWVSQVAGDILQARADLVAEVERAEVPAGRAHRVAQAEAQVISLPPGAASILPAADSLAPPPVVVIPEAKPLPKVEAAQAGAKAPTQPKAQTEVAPVSAPQGSPSGRYVLGGDSNAKQPARVRDLWGDESQFERRPFATHPGLGPGDLDDDDATVPVSRRVASPGAVVVPPAVPASVHKAHANETSGEDAASFYGEPRAVSPGVPTMPPEPPVMIEPQVEAEAEAVRPRSRADRVTVPIARVREAAKTMPPMAPRPPESSPRGTWSHTAIAFVLAALAVGALGIIALRWLGR